MKDLKLSQSLPNGPESCKQPNRSEKSTIQALKIYVLK